MPSNDRPSSDVPLSRACFALHRGYWAVRSLVLRRELRGFQDERGHWRVDAEDLDRLVRERNAGDTVPA